MTRRQVVKLSLFLAIVAVIWTFFYLELNQYLALDYIKTQQREISEYYLQHQIEVISYYMLIYILVTALSLPGAVIMTLLGAAIFGLYTGAIVISFASSIGATLAFLVSRFLLRDFVQSRFGEKLKTVNEGVEREGVFYLFTLRLIPAIPFFVINLVMGLTPMKVWKYYLVSQAAMLPGTIVYVNAGTQLASLESLSGILSPELLLSFVLLGLFPLMAKKSVEAIRSRRSG